jgi:pectin methylesterase-like acyl-CoA thioesterase
VQTVACSGNEAAHLSSAQREQIPAHYNAIEAQSKKLTTQRGAAAQQIRRSLISFAKIAAAWTLLAAFPIPSRRF